MFCYVICCMTDLNNECHACYMDQRTILPTAPGIRFCDKSAQKCCLLSLRDDLIRDPMLSTIGLIQSLVKQRRVIDRQTVSNRTWLHVVVYRGKTHDIEGFIRITSPSV